MPISVGRHYGSADSESYDPPVDCTESVFGATAMAAGTLRAFFD
jgi:hypothetical protein